MIANVLQAWVSLKRINVFLNEEETDKYTSVVSSSTAAGDPLVGFKNASFTYGSIEDQEQHGTDSFTLTGLDFAFPAERLSLVVGRGT